MALEGITIISGNPQAWGNEVEHTCIIGDAVTEKRVADMGAAMTSLVIAAGRQVISTSQEASPPTYAIMHGPATA